jgi:hypothetical protein
VDPDLPVRRNTGYNNSNAGISCTFMRKDSQGGNIRCIFRKTTKKLHHSQTHGIYHSAKKCYQYIDHAALNSSRHLDIVLFTRALAFRRYTTNDYAASSSGRSLSLLI